MCTRIDTDWRTIKGNSSNDMHRNHSIDACKVLLKRQFLVLQDFVLSMRALPNNVSKRQTVPYKQTLKRCVIRAKSLSMTVK